MDRNGSIHHYIIKSSEKIPVIKPALVVLTGGIHWIGGENLQESPIPWTRASFWTDSKLCDLACGSGIPWSVQTLR
jgi:hypothetical protein